MADLGWEDDDVTWGGVELSSKDFAPILLFGDSFYILGHATSAALSSYVERKAIVHVPGKVVIGREVWPQITGPEGEIIKISLGSHDTPDGGITWEGPYDFVIGSTEFLDFAVTGRYLAVRFESTTVPSWKLQSYVIDYEITGEH